MSKPLVTKTCLVQVYLSFHPDSCLNFQNHHIWANLSPQFWICLEFELKIHLCKFKRRFRVSWNDKVEKILKGSMDSISSPSPSVKIQIMNGKVCLRCKGKTLLGIVNKLLKTKSLLTSSSNVCLITSSKLSCHNLNFHWRWRWWYWIQAIFLNHFYFTIEFFFFFNGIGILIIKIFTFIVCITFHCAHLRFPHSKGIFERRRICTLLI